MSKRVPSTAQDLGVSIASLKNSPGARRLLTARRQAGGEEIDRQYAQSKMMRSAGLSRAIGRRVGRGGIRSIFKRSGECSYFFVYIGVCVCCR